MNNTPQHFPLWVFILLMPFFSYGQTLEVTDGNNVGFDPETIITNFFLGEGVDVTDIDYDGVDRSVGFFKGGDMIGIERGIVLTTGNAETQNGANLGADSNSQDFASVNNNSGVNDNDLNGIAVGSSVNNVTRYTITFIPTADTLRFRYVFASEEYPDYVCSEFNDIFGFFVSGPGINGPYENGAENIALIPETNLPVTINNVNPGVVGSAGNITNCTPPNGTLDFSNLYNTTPFNQQPVYNGFTDVFTAQVVVQPCETYVIKLVIADVEDEAFDSGVFLEAKSFGTGSLEVETATVSLDGTITEGCSEGVLTFALPFKTETDFVIDYDVLGTAINGTDYTLILEGLTIPAGDSSISVPIEAFEDGIEEGIESIMIDVQRDICNRDTFFFFIRDNDLLAPELREDTTICGGSSLAVDATLPIEVPPPPHFEWEGDLLLHPPNTLIYADLQVFGVFPVELGPNVIQSVCIDSLFHPWIDDIDLFIVAPSGQFMELSTDNGGNGGNGLAPDYYLNTCFSPAATSSITGEGIVAPPDSVPFTGIYQPEGEWIDIYGGPTNGTWRLMIVDDTADNVIFAGNLFKWSITFNSAYTIDYQWSPITGVECPDCPATNVSPTETTTYTVVATDSYGCEVSDDITIDVINQLPAPVIMCDGSSENSISIIFEEVPNADSYEININGGGWITPNGVFSHSVDNLTPGQEVTFQIRAVGDCEGAIGTVVCNTATCPQPSAVIDNLQNVSCNGGDNGSVSITASGGSGGPYNYMLGAESNDTGIFDGLVAGEYDIVFGDIGNCPDTITVMIEEPEILVSNEVIINDVSCNDGDDGSATVEVNGGTAPYSFFWENLTNDSITNSLSAGNSQVTIVDALGCSIIDTIEIQQPQAIVLDTIIMDASCANEEDGQAIVMASGGIGEYTYRWDDNAGAQTTDTAYTLAPGTYEVTVSDLLNCEATISVTIDAPESITLMTETTDASCSGVFDATATVTPLGGAGGYTFLWSDDEAQTTAMAEDLTVGDYFVIVTDVNNCFDTAFVTVDSPNAIEIQTTINTTSCIDTEDGNISLNVMGGTPNYTYAWSDGGATDDSRDDLAPGEHQVTVTDDNDCFEIVDFVIETADTLDITLNAIGLSCNGGDDGSATVMVTGGTGDYMYQWDNGDNATTSTATALPLGTVSVTVTDENDCSVSGSIDIMDAEQLSIDFSFTSPSCFEGDDATLTATAMGGAGGFTYQWDDGDNQNTQTAIDLPAGTYNVTATDDVDCEVTGTFIIPDAEEIITSTSVGTASCNGSPDGTASVNAIGGTEPYTYLWSNGQDTQQATALAETTHFVTVTDANACQAIDTVDVAAPDALSVELIATPQTCFGINDGTITAVASGGSGGYEYTWSDGTIGDTPTPTDLAPTTYTLTVTDINDCTTEESITVEPAIQMVLTTTPSHVLCGGDENGAIDLEVSGGATPYTFEWSNAATTEDISDLSGAVYIVTVTDANDCMETMEVTIEEPTAIVLTSSAENVLCFQGADGSIAIDAVGGMGDLSFEWEGPDMFTSTAEDLQNLTAGDYTLIVSDENNCTATTTINITQPAEGITGAIQPTETICFGADNGTATVIPNGGTMPYTYEWSNGATTATVTDLTVGIYSVTVMDSGDCSFTDEVTISSLPELSVTLNQTATSCHLGADGTASIASISYGNTAADPADFTYQWTTFPAQNTMTANNLLGGETYTVIITDAMGCQATASISIEHPAAVVLVSDNIQDVLCHDGNDGTATVSASGGTAPYTYQWDAAADAQTGATADSLAAGFYFVTATDANDCNTMLSVTIEEPRQLDIDLVSTDIDCNGDATGKVTTEISGGTTPYTYQWSNGANTPNVENLKVGEVQLTLTDNNGCVSEAIAFIEEPDAAVSGIVDKEDITCAGGHDGTIFVEGSGGTPGYTYSLDNDFYTSSNTLIGLEADSYRVYIKDSKGCIFLTDEVIIDEPEALEVELGDDIIIKYGETITLSPFITGAFGQTMYEWTPQDSALISCVDCENPEVAPPYQVSYKITVIDENGCEDEDIVTIYVSKERKVFVPTGFTPNDDGSNDLLLVHGPSDTKVLFFRIYDRWGELVYEASEFQVGDSTQGWNGQFRNKEMGSGSYIWYLDVEYADGETETLKGSSTLIR